MQKSKKNILICLLIGASLLIVVLYSPIGSPGLYYSANYYSDHQDVRFNGTKILNAPKIKYTASNVSNEMDIPDINSLSRSNYPIGSHQTTNNPTQGSIYNVQASSYQNTNSTGSGGFIGGGNTFLAVRSSRGSAGTSGVVMTNGITTMSLSTDLSNNLTRQSTTTYTAGTGATDPGTEPTGPPIPVGDGWGLLLVFGIAYAAIKRKFLG